MLKHSVVKHSIRLIPFAYFNSLALLFTAPSHTHTLHSAFTDIIIFSIPDSHNPILSPLFTQLHKFQLEILNIATLNHFAKRVTRTRNFI